MSEPIGYEVVKAIYIYLDKLIFIKIIFFYVVSYKFKLDLMELIKLLKTYVNIQTNLTWNLFLNQLPELNLTTLQ